MDFAIDSHFHIWDLQKFTYPWPTAEVPEIYKNFTATDYKDNLTDTTVKYGVFIQVLNNSIEEAKWVLQQSSTDTFIKGVVAGLNYTDHLVLNQQLEELSKYDRFVGCRHILDFEATDWISQETVKSAIEQIGHYGRTFDLLLRPHLLKSIPNLVASLPSQKFVVDHIAKPFIKEGKLEGWKTEMAEIAKYPNVHCKISGMVTEADLQNWKKEDIQPYVNHIINVFGADRVMYGSDWPVCTLAHAQYKDVFSLAQDLTGHLSEKEKCSFFKENAINFYGLKV